jgi:hypothetical protein
MALIGAFLFRRPPFPPPCSSHGSVFTQGDFFPRFLFLTSPSDFLDPSPFLSVHNRALSYFSFSLGFMLVIMLIMVCLGCHLTLIVGDTHAGPPDELFFPGSVLFLFSSLIAATPSHHHHHASFHHHASRSSSYRAFHIMIITTHRCHASVSIYVLVCSVFASEILCTISFEKDNASTILLGHGHKDVLSRHLIDSKIPVVILKYKPCHSLGRSN